MTDRADLLATIEKLVREGGRKYPCFDEDEFLDEVRKVFAVPEERRTGHTALRVRDGELEVFDKHPERNVDAAAKAWIQSVQVMPVLPPNAEEGFKAGAAWASSPQKGPTA